MSHREEILSLILARPGLTDAQIRRHTGIEPHQQVNQICRSLEVRGLIRRVVGRDGYIINVPAEHVERRLAVVPAPAWRDTPAPQGFRPVSSHTVLAGPQIVAASPGALIVTACSKAKQHGGVPGLSGRSILDSLPGQLAEELRDARARNAALVGLDETRLMPAVNRYSGFLYEQGRGAIRVLLGQGCEVVILSGGYGVVFADEPIGMYDCRFDPSMWRRHLVERILSTTAGATPARAVVGVLAGSSTYAAAFRGTDWPAGWRVTLVTPERTRGAQVRAPRAQGEALGALAVGGIPPGWRSSDGLGLEVEHHGRWRDHRATTGAIDRSGTTRLGGGVPGALAWGRPARVVLMVGRRGRP
jgi:hypothetical protein